MNSIDSVFLFCFCFWKYKYCTETSVTRFVKLIKTVYWTHFRNFYAKKKIYIGEFVIILVYHNF